MNTGIADAVDLGWKLAAVLHGWGGDQLLSSYDAERRPIGMRNVRMAAQFYLEHALSDDGLGAIEDDTPEGVQGRRRLGEVLIRGVGSMFRTTGLQLGYRYENSPICVSDGTSPCADNPAEVIPSARPGSRAPHAWLGAGRSTLDLYGGGFVLLRLGADAPLGAAFELTASGRGIPLETVVVTEPKVIELYEERLVLVRPDGHVAWRGDHLPDDVGAVVDTVRGVT